MLDYSITMKYINTYKLFESGYSESEITDIKRIIEYLYDIFQELIDKGIFVSIKLTALSRFVCHIGTYKQADFINYVDIVDYINSAIDYMRSVGYNIDDGTCLYDDSGWPLITDTFMKIHNGNFIDTKFTDVKLSKITLYFDQTK